MKKASLKNVLVSCVLSGAVVLLSPIVKKANAQATWTGINQSVSGGTGTYDCTATNSCTLTSNETSGLFISNLGDASNVHTLNINSDVYLYTPSINAFALESGDQNYFKINNAGNIGLNASDTVVSTYAILSRGGGVIGISGQTNGVVNTGVIAGTDIGLLNESSSTIYGIDNQAGGYIFGNSRGSIWNADSSLITKINNAGSIGLNTANKVVSQFGIYNSSSIIGISGQTNGVVNTGVIAGTDIGLLNEFSSTIYGIDNQSGGYIFGNSRGGIWNAGSSTITKINNAGSIGLNTANTVVSQYGINNSSSSIIGISGQTDGIVNSGVIAGTLRGITNAGTIYGVDNQSGGYIYSGSNGYGIYTAGENAVITKINNAGSIGLNTANTVVSQYGIYNNSSSTIGTSGQTDGVVNSGVIAGTLRGISNSGIIYGIDNQAGGYIYGQNPSGSDYGIVNSGSGSIITNINNAGSIGLNTSDTVVSTYGILNKSSGVIGISGQTDGIVNTGVIAGTDIGLLNESSSTIYGIDNQAGGYIYGLIRSGIWNTGASTITKINNAGSVGLNTANTVVSQFGINNEFYTSIIGISGQTDGIVNSGVIAGTLRGITNAATIYGIDNQSGGYIYSGSNGYGIYTAGENAVITKINNAGSIGLNTSDTVASLYGIWNSVGSTVGTTGNTDGITNSGVIVGSVRGITNSGTIHGIDNQSGGYIYSNTNGFGIYTAGENSVITKINNAGSIGLNTADKAVSQYAIYNHTSSTIGISGQTDGIVNTGTIAGTKLGVLNSGGTIYGIDNQSGGYIYGASLYGIDNAGSSLITKINNAGSIGLNTEDKVLSNMGIFNTGSSTIGISGQTDGIVNTGDIAGINYGIYNGSTGGGTIYGIDNQAGGYIYTDNSGVNRYAISNQYNSLITKINNAGTIGVNSAGDIHSRIGLMNRDGAVVGINDGSYGIVNSGTVSSLYTGIGNLSGTIYGIDNKAGGYIYNTVNNDVAGDGAIINTISGTVTSSLITKINNAGSIGLNTSDVVTSGIGIHNKAGSVIGTTENTYGITNSGVIAAVFSGINNENGSTIYGIDNQAGGYIYTDTSGTGIINTASTITKINNDGNIGLNTSNEISSKTGINNTNGGVIGVSSATNSIVNTGNIAGLDHGVYNFGNIYGINNSGHIYGKFGFYLGTNSFINVINNSGGIGIDGSGNLSLHGIVQQPKASIGVNDGSYGVINSGTIAGSTTGIWNFQDSIIYGIDNQSDGYIYGGTYGIYNYDDGIDNSTITKINNAGSIGLDGTNTVVSDSGISNLGTIGISGQADGIVNTGTIAGTGYGISNNLGGVIHGINNSGFIYTADGGSAVRNNSVGSLITSIINSGYIGLSDATTVSSRDGIINESNSNIGLSGDTDAISNSGTIGGTLYGIYNADTNASDGISTIYGINNQDDGVIFGGTAGGNSGIRNQGEGALITLITNAGLIGSNSDSSILSNIGIFNNAGKIGIDGSYGIVNSGTITSSGTGIINNANITGLSNSGTIGTSTSTGSVIGVNNLSGGVIGSSGLDYAINNTGTIAGTTGAGIQNAGNIGVLGDGTIVSTNAIYNDGGTIGTSGNTNGIVNTGKIIGTNAGIQNTNSATIHGIDNQSGGYIYGKNASSTTVDYGIINAGGSTITTINNAGTIGADSTSILSSRGIANSATIGISGNTDGIVNTGKIVGDTVALYNLNGTIHGIDNQDGGVIYGQNSDAGTIDYGISNAGVNALITKINNAGFIGSDGTTVHSSQGILNAATIGDSSVSYGIENSGTISGTSYGIKNNATGNITGSVGSILNTGTISGQTAAVQWDSSTSAMILTNTGDINGVVNSSGANDIINMNDGTIDAVSMGDGNDIFNYNGGELDSSAIYDGGDHTVVTRNINDGDTFNYNHDADLVNGDKIINWETINFDADGVINYDSSISTGNININSGTTLIIDDAQTMTGNLNNGGDLKLDSTGSFNLTGNYTGAGEIELNFAANNTAPTFDISGSATFDAGAILELGGLDPSLLFQGSTTTVITTGSTDTDIANLIVDDTLSGWSFDVSVDSNNNIIITTDFDSSGVWREANQDLTGVFSGLTCDPSVRSCTFATGSSNIQTFEIDGIGTTEIQANLDIESGSSLISQIGNGILITQDTVGDHPTGDDKNYLDINIDGIVGGVVNGISNNSELDGTITVGSTGTVYGGASSSGILNQGDGNYITSIDNAGLIGSDGSSILSQEGIANESGAVIGVNDGSYGITNTGTIVGGSYGIYNDDTSIIYGIDNSGTIAGDTAAIRWDNDSAGLVLNNTGTIAGDIQTAGGDDDITNTSTISGNIDLGDGDDTVANTGTISGNIDLGDGDNVVTNSGTAGSILAGSGDDTFTQTAGSVGNINFGDGANIITNSGVIRKVITGTGDDTFTQNAGSVGNIILGSGDDTFVYNGGTLARIDAGAGDTDTFDMNSIISIFNGSVYSNFEEVLVSTEGEISFSNMDGENITADDGTGVDNTWTISSGAVGTVDLGDGNNTLTSLGVIDSVISGSGSDVVNIDAGSIASASLGDGDDIFNYNGGDILGDIDGGNHTSGDVFNYNTNQDFTVGSNIVNFETVNINSGADINLESSITADNVNISSNSGLIIDDMQTISGNLVNSGSITLDAGSNLDVAGDFSSTGTINLILDGATSNLVPNLSIGGAGDIDGTLNVGQVNTSQMTTGDLISLNWGDNVDLADVVLNTSSDNDFFWRFELTQDVNGDWYLQAISNYLDIKDGGLVSLPRSRSAKNIMDTLLYSVQPEVNRRGQRNCWDEFNIAFGSENYNLDKGDANYSYDSDDFVIYGSHGKSYGENHDVDLGLFYGFGYAKTRYNDLKTTEDTYALNAGALANVRNIAGTNFDIETKAAVQIAEHDLSNIELGMAKGYLTTEADKKSRMFKLTSDFKYDMLYNGAYITPFVGFDYEVLNESDYSINSSLANINVAEHTTDNVYARYGVDFEFLFAQSSSFSLKAEYIDNLNNRAVEGDKYVRFREDPKLFINPSIVVDDNTYAVEAEYSQDLYGAWDIEGSIRFERGDYSNRAFFGLGIRRAF